MQKQSFREIVQTIWRKFCSWFQRVQWRPVLIRGGFIVGCVAILGALVYFAFLRAMPELLPLIRSGDEDAIAQYLGSSGSVTGIISTALLAFIQPVSIVLPGAPIQVAAGVVYGTLQGFLICHLSYLSANVAIFYVARTLRTGLDRLIPKKSKASKTDFLKKEKYPVYMTALACLIPVIPNGIIPYAAAKTRMKLHEFTLAVAIGSFFPILIMCAIGKEILHGDYLFAGGLLVGTLLLVLLLGYFRNSICTWMYRVGRRFRHAINRANDTSHLDEEDMDDLFDEEDRTDGR